MLPECTALKWLLAHGLGTFECECMGKKVPSQVEPFKKHPLDYGRHKLTGGSSAVSDRLSSESFPVWFPFKSTHMVRGCLRVSSIYMHSPSGIGMPQLQ